MTLLAGHRVSSLLMAYNYQSIEEHYPDESSRYKGRWEATKILGELYPTFKVIDKAFLVEMYDYAINKMPSGLEKTNITVRINTMRSNTVMAYYLILAHYKDFLLKYLPCEMYMMCRMDKDAKEASLQMKSLARRVGMTANDLLLYRMIAKTTQPIMPPLAPLDNCMDDKYN